MEQRSHSRVWIRLTLCLTYWKRWEQRTRKQNQNFELRLLPIKGIEIPLLLYVSKSLSEEGKRLWRVQVMGGLNRDICLMIHWLLLPSKVESVFAKTCSEYILFNELDKNDFSLNKVKLWIASWQYTWLIREQPRNLLLWIDINMATYSVLSMQFSSGISHFSDVLSVSSLHLGCNMWYMILFPLQYPHSSYWETEHLDFKSASTSLELVEWRVKINFIPQLATINFIERYQVMAYQTFQSILTLVLMKTPRVLITSLKEMNDSVIRSDMFLVLERGKKTLSFEMGCGDSNYSHLLLLICYIRFFCHLTTPALSESMSVRSQQELEVRIW